MSTISNRFYVTALEDGTTLHGSLSSTKPLTQAWNGNAAVPDWTIAANQPIIYLNLLAGATQIGSADISGIKWYYNNVEIVSGDARFEFGTDYPAPIMGAQSGTINVPYLKIKNNLASSSNVDIDLITFEGSYNISGSAVSFSATAQIRISTMSANGFLGVVSFVDGVSDITYANQTIKLYGDLYGGSDGSRIDTYAVKWYVNDVVVSSQTSSTTPYHAQETINSRIYDVLNLNEKDVTDHTVITCEFYADNTYQTLRYTAYVGVDDMQDPEYMYIQFNGANGNAASLRNGDEVKFYVWIGRREDPTRDTSYIYYQIKLLNGSGDVITGNVSNWPEDIGSGWREMFTDQQQGNKRYITITYDQVNTYQKNITGIIRASTAAFT